MSKMMIEIETDQFIFEMSYVNKLLDKLKEKDSRMTYVCTSTQKYIDDLMGKAIPHKKKFPFNFKDNPEIRVKANAAQTANMMKRKKQAQVFKNKGLKNTQIAILLGVTANTVSNYLREECV